MNARIFYSWQSDTPANVGRTFIERALTEAIRHLAQDVTLVNRPELDQDTRGIPGSPPIASTILGKIDQCTTLVADVTLTHVRRGRGRKKCAPNPNVLLETGYALKRLQHDRMLLVFDTASGRPEELPFDLRGYHLITYNSVEAAREPDLAWNRLMTSLGDALRLILTLVGPPADIAPPVEVSLKYSVRERTSVRHGYRLPVRVTNTGMDEIRNWSVEVAFPRAMLEPALSFPNLRALENDMVAIRQTEAGYSGPFAPGETKETIGIDYYMDDRLYQQRATLFPREVTAAFFVDGKRIARAVSTVEQLQDF